LVVGHDSFPSKQLWVIEGGKVESPFLPSRATLMVGT